MIYAFNFFLKLNYNKSKSADTFFLRLSFFLIFLLCALRDYSVGRDIPGYIEVYKLSSQYSFGDCSWIYMEEGYVLLMQICSYIGLSPRMFLVIVYAIMTYPIYYIIKRYSVDYLLSTIIYISYQFLSFNLSGIRQGLATSICLMALPFAFVKNLKDGVSFLLIVLLASTIHQSSLVFLAIPVILNMKYNIKSNLILLASMVLAPLFTTKVLTFVHEQNLSSTSYNSSVSLGGTLLFLIFVALFVIYACVKQYRSCCLDNTKNEYQITHYALLIMAAITISLLFSGSMLLRSTMFYTILLVLCIPKAIQMYPRNIQPLFCLVFHFAMLLFFYIFCLVPKILDTVPYKFGTDLFF